MLWLPDRFSRPKPCRERPSRIPSWLNSRRRYRGAANLAALICPTCPPCGGGPTLPAIACDSGDPNWYASICNHNIFATVTGALTIWPAPPGGSYNGTWELIYNNPCIGGGSYPYYLSCYDYGYFGIYSQCSDVTLFNSVYGTSVTGTGSLLYFLAEGEYLGSYFSAVVYPTAGGLCPEKAAYKVIDYTTHLDASAIWGTWRFS